MVDGADETGASETVSGSEEVVPIETMEDISGSLEVVVSDGTSEVSLDVSVLSTALLEIEDVSSWSSPPPMQAPIPPIIKSIRITGISIVVTFDFFFVFTFGSPFNYKMIV